VDPTEDEDPRARCG